MWVCPTTASLAESVQEEAGAHDGLFGEGVSVMLGNIRNDVPRL